MLLSQFISQDIPLVRRDASGRYWTSREHQSLIVDDKRGKWNWYAQNAWGDEVDWAIFWRKTSREEAYRLTRCEENQSAYEAKPLPADKVEKSQKNIAAGLPYLNRRGISKESAIRWRLGYLNGKIVIPNYGTDGNLISVRYRLTYHYEKEGRLLRYFSEPGSHPYLPYGTWNLPEARSVLFLAEGEFKTICVNQMGFECIGTQGTLFRPDWKLIVQKWPNVVYLRDSGDLAGIKAAIEIIKLIPNVHVLAMPRPYKAVDDYFLAEPEKCLQLLGETHERVSTGKVRQA